MKAKGKEDDEDGEDRENREDDEDREDGEDNEDDEETPFQIVFFSSILKDLSVKVHFQKYEDI